MFYLEASDYSINTSMSLPCCCIKSSVHWESIGQSKLLTKDDGHDNDIMNYFRLVKNIQGTILSGLPFY